MSRTRNVLLTLLAAVLGLGVWVWQPWEPSRKRFFSVMATADAAPPESVVFVSEQDAGVTMEVAAKGFTLPWDLAFLSERELLVTEKAGRLWRVDLDRGTRIEISGLPEVRVQGQGGLHAVILHPKFAQNGWVYLSYAAPDGKGANTHVARAKLVGDKLEDVRVLFAAQAPAKRGQHFGGAMVFDREGYLYLSVGDRGERDDAQTLATHNGKIMRLHDDGRVPDDNPFVGTAGARPEIWSWGHRNPQGLVLDPAGHIWEAEHGPQGGDEINRIERGRNYGWPIITYGREYGSGQRIGDGETREDVPPPVHVYVPSIATAGIAYSDGARYPQWKDSVFVAALRGHLNRVQVDANGAFLREERLLSERNLRLRAVRFSPGGELYAAADDGVIVRLVPAATK